MLYLDGGQRHLTQLGYDCGVFFYAASGKCIHEKLAKSTEILERNPFDIAMGRLGGYGWELVSAQHATATAASGSDTVAGYLSWIRKVAYFKRAVLEGREVNDAQLK